MNKKIRIFYFAAIAVLGIFITSCESNSESKLIQRITELEKDDQLIVQIAELEIDPAQLNDYTALLQEGIATSVKKEPGVLSLYAMANKDAPHKITVVEVYASLADYESHISSPHFLKYKNGTMEMVKSLTLTRTTPVIFAAKSN